MLRAFGPLGREGPSRAFTRFFAGRSSACTQPLPQPLPSAFSMLPLSTGPLSPKGVLPPPPPSLGALFGQQAHLHHTTAGAVTPPACSPPCSVLPATRALTAAHPSCCGHLVLEVNNLVNTCTCSPSSQILQGTAAIVWLLCLMCAVATMLCLGSMPRVLQHGWGSSQRHSRRAIKVEAGASRLQTSTMHEL